MAKQYDLSIVVKLVDKVSHNVSKVSHSVGKLSNAMDIAGNSASSAGFKLSSVAGPIAKTAGAIGAAALGIGVWAAKGALSFDESMKHIAMSLTGTQPQIESRLNKMRSSIQDLSKEFDLGWEEIAEGTVAAVKMFKDVPDLMARVRKASQISQVAGETTVRDIVSATGDIMQAYGKNTLEVYNDVANILSYIARKSPATFRITGAAMGRTAATAAALGVSYKELMATFGPMTRMGGTRASSVGFQLATMLDSLAKFKDVPKVIGQIGWIGFLEKLKEAVSGDKEAALTKMRGLVGGSRALAGALWTLGPGIKGIKTMMEELGGVEDDLNKRTKLATEGFLGQQYRVGQLGRLFTAVRQDIGRFVVQTLDPVTTASIGRVEQFLDLLRDIQDRDFSNLKVFAETNAELIALNKTLESFSSLMGTISVPGAEKFSLFIELEAAVVKLRSAIWLLNFSMSSFFKLLEATFKLGQTVFESPFDLWKDPKEAFKKLKDSVKGFDIFSDNRDFLALRDIFKDVYPLNEYFHVQKPVSFPVGTTQRLENVLGDFTKKIPSIPKEGDSLKKLKEYNQSFGVETGFPAKQLFSDMFPPVKKESFLSKIKTSTTSGLTDVGLGIAAVSKEELNSFVGALNKIADSFNTAIGLEGYGREGKTTIDVNVSSAPGTQAVISQVSKPSFVDIIMNSDIYGGLTTGGY